MSGPISIVLPTHNRAYVLWRAIASVQAQGFKDWELIVVDDGSTDCTARLVEEFHDSRLRYIRIERSGPSGARNRGVAASRFDLIAYIDSDNTWRPDYLQTMAAEIDRHDGRVWYCGQHTAYWERTADGRWFKIDEETIARARYGPEQALNLRGPDTNCMIHTKESWRRVGGWDEGCHWLEDWDFFTRMLLEAPTGAHWVDAVLVDYRQVYGTGADGICGEAREDRRREIAGRRYLLEKWGDRLGPKARRRLSYAEADLPLMRAGLWSCAS